MRYRLQIALPLWLVYLSLTQKSWQTLLPNMILGALIAMGISLLFPPRSRPFNWSGFFSFLVGVLQYVWLVVTDMFKSAYNVGRIVLDPKLPIRPGILAIKSGCQNPAATALSAHAITLTPGEMVIAIGEDGTLYTHTLDIERSEAHSGDAQELRRTLLRKLIP